ncbi:hypothetical protein, partial [Thiolapillus sp.]|uniref:hypothetical protein n=1 Tax=Thiolapillus sp. TaxID=2017437 RepID=UPI003AF71C4D
AERQRRASGLVVHKELYKKAKHCVTRIVMKAKSLFYNCKISSAFSIQELYSITNNLLAKTKSTPLPQSYFRYLISQDCSLPFFVTKSSNSDLTLILSLYAPVLYL